MLKRITFLFLLVFCLCLGVGGQTRIIDSLKKNVAGSLSERDRLNALLQLCEERNSLNSDSLYAFAARAKVLATKLNDPDRSFQADYYIASSLEKKGLFDSTQKFTELKLKDTRQKQRNLPYYRRFRYLAGTLQIRKNQYKEALSLFFTLLNLADQSNDTLSQVAARGAIGWTYMEMNQPNEALEWFYKTLNTTADPAYERYYIATYINMSAVFGMTGRFDSVKLYVEKAISKAREHQMLTYLSNALNLKASLFMTTNRNSLARAPLEEALAIRKQIGDPFYIVADIAQLASYYTNSGELGKAISLSNEGIELSNKYQLTGKLPMLYNALALAYKLKGDLPNYSKAIEMNIKVRDSLYQANTAEAIAEIEAKYELQKKENTIIRQQLELVKRGYLLAGIVGLSILLGIVAYILFSNYRKRQKLKVERILEEEKMAAARAIREAEETERVRIAADLHDNLGAYAASIAYNLDNVIVNNQGVTSALEELRANSQAMVAELSDTIWALKKDALKLTAISDRIKLFIQRLQNTYTHINIDVVEDISNDVLLQPSQAFHLLRIIQEALNNSLKHSHAKNIVVSIHSNAFWKASIKDDGKGITGKTNSMSGNGLSNMRHRAEVSGWDIKWHSDNGKGTEVIICSTTN